MAILCEAPKPGFEGLKIYSILESNFTLFKLLVGELSTKINLTTWQSNTTRTHDFHGEYILLHPTERDVMHNRIAKRFDSMLSDGLVEEVECLLKKSDVTLDLTYPSMRAIGYKQVWEYLHNIIDKDTMRESAIVATRRYFKRQCTWLKHWEHPYRSFADVASAKRYLATILPRQVK